MRNKFKAFWMAAIALAIASVAMAAAPTLGFETPAKTVMLPSSTVPPTGGAVTCVFYHDVMVRVSGTDTASPGNAMILPQPADCGGSKPNGLELPSSGFAFVGRLGDFLVFELADPSGASLFAIFNLRNGKKLYQDGVFGADGYLGVYGITAVNLAQGIVQMRYLRGVNTSCSLLSDRDGCWARLLANGDVPRGVFAGPPSIESCMKDYENGRIGLMPPIPADDPSIVSYDVALTLDSNGNAKVHPFGAPRCDPMP